MIHYPKSFPDQQPNGRPQLISTNSPHGTGISVAPPANAAEITCSLHWLPIRQRIHFNLALLAYNARHYATIILTEPTLGPSFNPET